MMVVVVVIVVMEVGVVYSGDGRGGDYCCGLMVGVVYGGGPVGEDG